MLYFRSKLKILKMPRKDRNSLVAVEVSIQQANYLKQKYNVRTRTEAVRLALDDFCRIPDFTEALTYDHDKCLAVSEETKVRLMKATDYPDWRFAALHIISDYLYYYERQQTISEEQTNV